MLAPREQGEIAFLVICFLCAMAIFVIMRPTSPLRLGQNNPHTRSLEAWVYAYNKERVCGLVRPNPPSTVDCECESWSMAIVIMWHGGGGRVSWSNPHSLNHTWVSSRNACNVGPFDVLACELDASFYGQKVHDLKFSTPLWSNVDVKLICWWALPPYSSHLQEPCVCVCVIINYNLSSQF